MKFSSAVYKLDRLNTHYIEIPLAVVKKLGGKFNIRLLCTLNNKLTFQCGIVALGEGKGYISLNAKRLAELNLKKGNTVEVLLKKDDSEFGAKVPEELAEVFAQDQEGFKRFEILVAGKQRFIIRHVTAVKNSQLKIERALAIIHNLKKLPLGKETFKGMMGIKE
ncbi:MAG: DUF1905 domain-containing protein [Cytophagaceae bacterium]|nr:DUF1905 domain-containing protein [Cytophagaceae bacterium]